MLFWFMKETIKSLNVICSVEVIFETNLEMFEIFVNIVCGKENRASNFNCSD